MSANTPTNEPILVFGATGRQGGAVARHLSASGFRVRAATRNPDRAEARGLARSNIDVVKADMNDRMSVEQAMRGAYGVFSVQDFWQAGFEDEIRQGTLVADVARSLGVQHFVYTSVASADGDTDLPHFESKWIIEQHIREIGLPFTILRPVFFMDNWEYLREPLLAGTLPQPLSPERTLQQIAVDDVGAVAVLAFCNPGKWLGRIAELAGDELSMSEVAQGMSRALGRSVRYVQVPWDDFERSTCREMTRMYRWFQQVGYGADVASLRNDHAGLADLDEYLRNAAWVRASAHAGATA